MRDTVIRLCLLLWVTCAATTRERKCKLHWYGTHADCSNRGLTSIPRDLPSTVTDLDFGNNNLGNLTSETFQVIAFPRYNITFLNISENHITHVSSNAFTSLMSLKILILDQNVISKTDLQHTFQSLNRPKFKHLSLNGLLLNGIKENFFVNLNRSGIQKLNMGFNNFQKINMSVFRPLRHLSYLDLSKNFIYNLTLMSDMTMSTLVLNSNSLSLFCYENISISALKRLELVENNFKYVKHYLFCCAPNLSYLHLSLNPIRTIHNNTFFCLSKLNELQMNLISDLKRIDAYAINNSHVQTISMKNSEIRFEGQISSKAFHGCSNIKNLELSGNIMTETNSTYFSSLFQPMWNTLQYLGLSDNILRFFPNLSFPHLTRLRIASNEITHLHGNNFPPNIQYINLYDNDITIINEFSLPENFEDIDTIDLGYNPFACTCELLWFLQVFSDDRYNKIFKKSTEEYKCASPNSQNGKNLTDFAKTMGIQKCLLASTVSLIIIFASVFFLILLIIGSVLYHFRWHFRYFIFLLRQARYQPISNVFTYDAFLCYSGDDITWVVNKLLPKLENEENLSLCLHQREFEPGAYKMDCIMQTIRTSRRFIVLLTDNLAKDDWSMFTLNLIIKHVGSREEGSLIYIKVGNIDLKHMNNVLFDILDKGNYIEYPAESAATEQFWKNVLQVLKPRCHSTLRENSVSQSQESNWQSGVYSVTPLCE